MNSIKWVCFCLLAHVSISGEEGKDYIRELNSYIKSRTRYHQYEGNIYARNTTQPNFFIDLIANNPSIKTIGEIGFNAGHSSVLFLTEVYDSKVYSFDIMYYRYCRIAKEFIDLTFPDRHTLIKGDSTRTLYSYATRNPDVKFDLIFIDGGHHIRQALADMRNMYHMAHEDTIVVIDDMHKDQSVYNAFMICKDEGLFIEEEFFHHENAKNWVKCKYNFNR